MSRKGRKAAPDISSAAEIKGLLCSPFATQGRSYRERKCFQAPRLSYKHAAMCYRCADIGKGLKRFPT